VNKLKDTDTNQNYFPLKIKAMIKPVSLILKSVINDFGSTRFFEIIPRRYRYHQ